MLGVLYASAQVVNSPLGDEDQDVYTLLSREPGEVLIRQAAPGPYRYRMVLKTAADSTRSLIFVEVMEKALLTKVAIAYSTPNDVRKPEWEPMLITFSDLYHSCVRQSSTCLEGRYMDMDVKIYQRPHMFPDIIVFDGIVLESPVKVHMYESEHGL